MFDYDNVVYYELYFFLIIFMMNLLLYYYVTCNRCYPVSKGGCLRKNFMTQKDECRRKVDAVQTPNNWDPEVGWVLNFS